MLSWIAIFAAVASFALSNHVLNQLYIANNQIKFLKEKIEMLERRNNK